MTLQEYINKLNAAGAHYADAAYFQEFCNIATPEEFDIYMDRAFYSDWHKERYGFRPREFLPIEEIRAIMECWATQDRQDKEDMAWVYEEPVKPANNPFAMLLGK